MNRKILSALLIAVITVMLAIYIQTTTVTNENQETEKLTVTDNNQINSGITKELGNIIKNSDNKTYSGVMNDIYLTLDYCMDMATTSYNNVDVVGDSLEEVIEEPEVITTMFTDSYVNCRTEPNIESEIIEIINLGAELQTVGNEQGWYKVKLENGTYGYIYEEYVRDTNPLEYIGEYKLTYYTDSVQCCGVAGQKTASGHTPVEGTTIAADPSIPFGTKLYINGNIYTVQDRGSAIKGNVIDVYKDLPDEALMQLGVDYADVYIYNE